MIAPPAVDAVKAAPAKSGPAKHNTQSESNTVAGEWRALDLADIRPNPDQPRKHFGDLTELATSIRAHGLLEPVLVRPVPGGYELVHGERRWRAAALAGLKTIAAMVRDLSDDEAFLLALVENIQRENLNPIEEANALKHLLDGGRTQAEAGALVGKGQSYVAHKMRLLATPEPIAFYLHDGALTEGHVRQLLRLRDIYPAGLVRQFNVPAAGADVPAEDGNVAVFLHQLRPEDKSPFFGVPPETVKSGLKVFVEYVTRHNGEVEQWVVAAAWWAGLSAMYDLSVADLGIAITAWRERYETALIWWELWHDSRHDSECDEGLWWAFQSDLRHSGSLGLQLKDSLGRPRYLRLIETFCNDESFILPIQYQHPAEAM